MSVSLLNFTLLSCFVPYISGLVIKLYPPQLLCLLNEWTLIFPTPVPMN